MEDVIKLRPHHIEIVYNKLFFSDPKLYEDFLVLTKNGHYKPDMILNANRIIEKIRDNPKQMIEIVPGMDDICKKCEPRASFCGKNETMTKGLNLAFGLYTAGEVFKKAYELWSDEWPW